LSQYQSTVALGQWQGFRVKSVKRIKSCHEGDRDAIVVELLPVMNRLARCRECGKKVHRTHDWSTRLIDDLPAWGARTILKVHSRRVKCSRCGIGLEMIDWVDIGSRVTTRLAQSLSRMCEVLPVAHVAAHYGIGWNRVKRIHKRHLQETLNPINLSGVRVIGMDEFAIQSGHRYATVVTDMLTKRVLWVGRGRGREDVRPFYQLLGPSG